jgi:hypothetical protein
VPIADISALTGVALDQLAAVDRLGAAPAETVPTAGQVAVGWRELHSFEDVTVTR